jgi:hypothetical protein
MRVTASQAIGATKGTYGPFKCNQILVAIEYPSLYTILNKLTVYKDVLSPSGGMFLVKVVLAFGWNMDVANAWAGDSNTLGKQNLTWLCQSYANWSSGTAPASANDASSRSGGGRDMSASTVSGSDTSSKNVFAWLYDEESFADNLGGVATGDAIPECIQNLFEFGLCGFAVLNGRLSTDEIMQQVWQTKNNPVLGVHVWRSCHAEKWNAAVQGAVGGAAFGGLPQLGQHGITQLFAEGKSQATNGSVATGALSLLATLGGMVAMGSMAWKKAEKTYCNKNEEK